MDIPLSLSFYVLKRRVKITCVNKLKARYERSRVNVKVVETRSTFTFTSGTSYIASILFTCVKYTSVRTSYVTVKIHP